MRDQKLPYARLVLCALVVSSCSCKLQPGSSEATDLAPPSSPVIGTTKELSATECQDPSPFVPTSMNSAYNQVHDGNGQILGEALLETESRIWFRDGPWLHSVNKKLGVEDLDPSLSVFADQYCQQIIGFQSWPVIPGSTHIDLYSWAGGQTHIGGTEPHVGFFKLTPAGDCGHCNFGAQVYWAQGQPSAPNTHVTPISVQ